MTTSLSHRLLAAMLERAQKEKQERLHSDWSAQQIALDREAEERKRELLEIEKKRKELEERKKREEGELEDLKRALNKEDALALEESDILAVQRRMQDFRGNDDASLKNRLHAEGFSEQLTDQLLNFRTKDQAAPNVGGLRANFDRFPGALEDALRHEHEREQGVWKPDAEATRSLYSQNEPEREKLYQGGLPEAVSDTYGRDNAYGKAPDARQDDIEHGIRKGLGLDLDTSIQYGNVKR